MQKAKDSNLVLQNTLQPRNENQKLYLDSIHANRVTFGLGPAGVGKTLVAIGAAITELARGRIDKIIITRPVVESGENLGFLPGSYEQKLAPYMMPCYNELENFISSDVLFALKQDKRIEVVPFAYMRGLTFKNSLIVADELQNATQEQIYMLLTRLGNQSTLVLDGDPEQSDLPYRSKGGLVFWAKLLEGVPAVNSIWFNKNDVVRDKVVSDIVGRYEEYKDKIEPDGYVTAEVKEALEEEILKLKEEPCPAMSTDVPSAETKQKSSSPTTQNPS